MIKVYVEYELRMQAKAYETFPLLEELEKDQSPLHMQYQLVDEITQADFGLVPMNIEFLIKQGKRKPLNQFLNQCRSQNLPVLVFSGGDYGVSLNLPMVHTIRLGGFHQTLPPHTYIMPPFINDPLNTLNKEFHALYKSDLPTVGFVGHSNGSWKKWLKEYLLFLKGNLRRALGYDPTDRQPFYPSAVKRHRLLQLLETSPKIQTSIVYRQRYRAGVRNEEDKERTSQEFYQNIFDNLYTFCLRGTGNFSVRFYETLAMGRIPVLVNTDCRLPFQDQIDWSRHIVLVEAADASQLPERVYQFHQTHDSESLHQIQRENRNLWENYFQRNSYFKQLAQILTT